MNSTIDFSLFIGQMVKDIEVDSRSPYLKFRFGALHVECFWRVRNREYLLYGKDDPQALERLRQDLLGRTVTNVWHAEFPSDLVVEFDGNLYLDAVCSGTQGESWQMTRPDGFFLVAGPSGRYTFWEPELELEIPCGSEEEPHDS
jgi:hypothetical protein